MAKNKKARLIEDENGRKLCVVASVNDEHDLTVDSRSKKPIGIKEKEDIIYMQEINRIEFSTKKKNEKNILSYFAPNNVGVLLSISNRALMNAKNIYKEKIDPNMYNHTDILAGNTGNELMEMTLVVYEFIEAIQTSIVFGYTAVEAFTNLSIHSDYQYLNEVKGKGITEVYDKKAIERWLSLDVKISNILVDIYECKSIKKEKIWSRFKEFEQCRNQIIHQKSIDANSFYEKYFNDEIFELCDIPEKIIKFFFGSSHKNGTDNLLWPLVVSSENTIPIISDPTAHIDECVGVVSDY
ncbi:hypothetical protein OQL72_000296 [Clostridium perfringens]